MVPKVNARVPDYSATAGASAYGSLRRLLFLDASLFHTQDFGEGTEGWVYGGASAYGAIPLGIQLGTRGGAGLFLDQVQPGIEYRNMSRFIRLDEKDPASALRPALGGRSRGDRSARAQGPGPFDALAAAPRSEGLLRALRGIRLLAPRGRPAFHDRKGDFPRGRIHPFPARPWRSSRARSAGPRASCSTPWISAASRPGRCPYRFDSRKGSRPKVGSGSLGRGAAQLWDSSNSDCSFLKDSISSPIRSASSSSKTSAACSNSSPSSSST